MGLSSSEVIDGTDRDREGLRRCWYPRGHPTKYSEAGPKGLRGFQERVVSTELNSHTGYKRCSSLESHLWDKGHRPSRMVFLLGFRPWTSI